MRIRPTTQSRRNAYAEAIAAVATVYCEPAKEVTLPAPLVASVMAAPPTEVTTVTADPPIASKLGQGHPSTGSDLDVTLTSY